MNSLINVSEYISDARLSSTVPSIVFVEGLGPQTTLLELCTPDKKGGEINNNSKQNRNNN